MPKRHSKSLNDAAVLTYLSSHCRSGDKCLAAARARLHRCLQAPTTKCFAKLIVLRTRAADDVADRRRTDGRAWPGRANPPAVVQHAPFGPPASVQRSIVTETRDGSSLRAPETTAFAWSILLPTSSNRHLTAVRSRCIVQQFANCQYPQSLPFVTLRHLSPYSILDLHSSAHILAKLISRSLESRRLGFPEYTGG